MPATPQRRGRRRGLRVELLTMRASLSCCLSREQARHRRRQGRQARSCTFGTEKSQTGHEFAATTESPTRKERHAEGFPCSCLPRCSRWPLPSPFSPAPCRLAALATSRGAVESNVIQACRAKITGVLRVVSDPSKCTKQRAADLLEHPGACRRSRACGAVRPAGPAGPAGRRGRKAIRAPADRKGNEVCPGLGGPAGNAGRGHRAPPARRAAAGAQGAAGPQGPPGPKGDPGRGARRRSTTWTACRATDGDRRDDLVSLRRSRITPSSPASRRSAAAAIRPSSASTSSRPA